MSNLRKLYTTDEITGTTAMVNSEGKQDIVSHQHPDGGHIYFRSDVSTTTDFILIDMSDTINYPHVNTDHVHTANISVNIDATSNADYEVCFGYLANVDATNGDFREFFAFSGTRKTGNNVSFFYSAQPESPRLTSSRIATSSISLNDTAFQTDVNMKSTLDPTTADTPSGNGDVVMRVTMNAGTINLAVLLGYHSHSA